MKPTNPTNQRAIPIASQDQLGSGSLFNCPLVILSLLMRVFASFTGAFLQSKIFPNVLLVLMFSTTGIIVNAQISSTRTGGNWNSTSTWIGGVVPGIGAAVNIEGGATVVVNVNNAICSSIRIGVGTNSTGTLSFNSGTVLTVVGNITLGTNGQRKASVNMNSGGILKIGGTISVANLNVFAGGSGTVEYNGNGPQTVGALGIYNNLVFSGSGVKSLIAGTTISGKLSILGAVASIGSGLNISVGSLTLGAVNKASGTWGALISSATNKDNIYFASTSGILTVTIDGRTAVAFSGIVLNPTITYGAPTITLNGILSGAGQTYPANGETVSITLNGVVQNAVISGGAGGFSITFPTALLNVASSPYTIQYGYMGSMNLAAANNSNTSLRVNPASLIVTANNISKGYGSIYRFSGTEFKTTGLLNGNTVTGVTLASAGAIATAPVAGSPYPIVPSAALGFGLGNYLITYNNGVLTVVGLSQSSADFRSRTNGSFSSPGSWQFDEGGNSWTNATQSPGSNNNILIEHAIALNQHYTTGAGKTLLISTGGSLSIEPGIALDVAPAGTLNFNAKPVNIMSTVSGTGSIGKILGTLTGASNVTVERYLGSNKRAWRFLTIPVTGTTIRDAWAGIAANATAPSGETGGSGTLITGHNLILGTAAASAGFDWFPGLGSSTTSSIRFYSLSAGWASASNTPNPLTVPAKEGYLLYVRGDRTIANNTNSGITTLKPKGTLKQGQQIISVNESYTVVGNPYACAINLDAMYGNAGNSTIIKRNFWVWDATLGSSGGYRTLSWNGVDEYDMTGGAGLASDYMVVNSGQAFFVERLAGGNISITEQNKITASTPKTLRPGGIEGTGVSSLDIRLYQASGNSPGLQADRVVARFNDIYDASDTEIYDAAKLNNFNENLSLVRNKNYLSIESRPFPTQNDTLYLPFWGLLKRDYALTIASNRFKGINQTARFIDAFTNKVILIDLNDSSVTYPFAVTSDPASISLNRFIIILSPLNVLPVTFIKTKANPVGTQVQVSWQTTGEQCVKNYIVERSADGTHFNKTGEVGTIRPATIVNYHWIDEKPLSGSNYYRLRSTNTDGKNAYSEIVKVFFNGKKGMEVSPSVISNQRFTLNFNDQPAGDYQLIMINAAGQTVFQKLVSTAGGSNSRVIELGKSTLATGIYNVSVRNAHGAIQNIRLLVAK